jgi:hypothetical protein
MAKKEKIEEVEETYFEETMEETLIDDAPPARERLKPSNEWEIKDRTYFLQGNKKPVSYAMRST